VERFGFDADVAFTSRDELLDRVTIAPPQLRSRNTRPSRRQSFDSRRGDESLVIQLVAARRSVARVTSMNRLRPVRQSSCEQAKSMG
jgi:hypothetical protein